MAYPGIEKDIQITTSEPIAIIGIGCLFPKAQNLREYWSNIKNKVDAITDIPPTHWDPKDYYHPDPKKPDHTYCKRGGFIPAIDFDPSEYGITPQALEAIDSSQLLGLVVASAALEDAGYGSDKNFDRSKVAVILGLTGTLELVIPLGARLGHPIWRKALKKAGIPDDIAQEVIQNIADSYVTWQENSFPGLLGNVAAGRISNRLNLQGTNCIVDAACGSSLAAVHLALLELETKRAYMAITGGIDTFNDIFMYMCFSKTPALSPTQDARPFSIDSDGTILGEGIGMVVLKRLSDAIKDNDKIYCIIKGIGTSSDGRGKAIYAPSADGQILAIKRAHELANITPNTIELIEAHGTGTKVGDEVEITALKNIFSTPPLPKHSIAIGSVKSQIGHTKAAAGTAGLIKVALALHHKTIPPTIKISKPNPLLTSNSAFYLPNDIRPWFKTQQNNNFPRRAGVSSFGFGGSNYHAILEEYNQSKSSIDWTNSVEIISFSSNNYNELINDISVFKQNLDKEPLEILCSKSRLNFSNKKRFKLVFSYITKNNNISSLLQNIITTLNSHFDKLSKETSDLDNLLPKEIYTNVWFNNHNTLIPSAIIFPGQGSQYCNMGLHFVCTFPDAFNTLQIAENIIPEITKIIFPIPLFDEEYNKNCESQLTKTYWAQPAIGATSIAYCNVLKMFGYNPSALAGHSYGELPALCLANAFNYQDLIKISNIRGKLMSQAFSNNSLDSNFATGMLAIAADVAKVLEIIQKENLDLEIANENSPQQVVVSGEFSLVKSLHDTLKNKYKVKSTLLNVSGAFHSKFMISAVEPFINALKEINISPPSTKVYSNTTANLYPSNPHEIIHLLANQLAKPVKFVSMIEQMYKDGIRIFIEPAPSAKLSNLIASIIANKSHKILTLDSHLSKKEPLLELANTLAYLAVSNYDINLKLWEDSENKILKYKSKPKKITYKICGANFRFGNPNSSSKSNSFFENNTSSSNIRKEWSMEKSILSTNQVTSNSNNGISNNSSSDSSIHTNTINSTQNYSQNQKLPNIQQMPQNINNSIPPILSPTTNNNSFSHPLNQQNQNPQNLFAPNLFSPNNSIVELETLKLCKETISSLQQLQLYTTNAHKQFLETQEKTAIAIQSIIDKIYNSNLHQQFQNSFMPSNISKPQLFMPNIPQPNFNNIQNMYQHPQSPSSIPTFTHQNTPFSQNINQDSNNTTIFSPSPNNNSNITNISKSLHTNQSEHNYLSQTYLEQKSSINSISSTFSNSSLNLPPSSSITQDKSNLSSSPPSSQIQTPSLNQIYDSSKSNFDPQTSNGTIDNPSIALQTTNKTKNILDTNIQNIQKSIHLRNESSSLLNSTLQIISDKTGYPIDMLNPNMDMEADLGIDSIKRVEIMSAIQEKFPNLPSVPPEQINKFKTIQNIIDYLSSENSASNHLSHNFHNNEPNISKHQSSQIETTQNEKNSKFFSKNDIQSNINFENTSSNLILQTPCQTPFLNAVISIISEKTGYPTEMLNLNMDMEADLGIDSIKRVEIMSAIQEKFPTLPAVPPEEVSKFKTINNIIEYLTKASSSGNISLESQQSSNPNIEDKKKISITPNNKNLTTSINASSNIDNTQKIPNTEFFILDNSKICQVSDLSSKILHSRQKNNDYDSKLCQEITQEYICKNYSDLISSLNVTYLQASLYQEPQKTIPIYLPAGTTVAITDDKSELVRELICKFTQNGYNITTLDLFDKSTWNLKPNTHALIIVFPQIYSHSNQTTFWTHKSEEIIFLSFKILQHSVSYLKNSANSGPVIFATISRMDGKFGLDYDKSNLKSHLFDPCQGGLAGLAKTVQKEIHELTVKAFDVDNNLDPQEQAEKILYYMFKTTPVELGIHSKGTYILEEKAHTTSIELNIDKNCLSSTDVIVVTGGGRGITSEIATALAKAYKPTLVLLGRTPMPSEEPAWLKNLTTEFQIKQGIVKNYSNGTNLKPKDLESIYKSIIANREVLKTLNQITELGSKVYYKQVNIKDKSSIENTINEIKSNIGEITGIIHGAGVLRDRRIEDKTDDQFLDVFETKVTGLRHILSVIQPEKLKLLVLFSSSTARYGRLGQVDYAISNEILNKIAQKFSKTYSQTTVLSFNWGPWEGGMVNESLKKLFISEGIGLISFQSGSMLFLDILNQAFHNPQNFPKEIIVIGTIDNNTKNSNNQLTPSSKNKPKIVLEKEVSVNTDKYLLSHIIDYKPVLPAAFLIEYLAYGAISSNPGLEFYSLENFKVLKGLVLERPNYASKILILASKATNLGNGKYKTYVEIRNAYKSDMIHASAEIILTDNSQIQNEPLFSTYENSITDLSKYPFSVQETYKNLLFHGKDFQMIMEIIGWSENKIAIKINTSKQPNYYSLQPLNSYWITDPISIDGAFQAVILWTLAKLDCPSLPSSVGKYTQFSIIPSNSIISVIAEITRFSNYSTKANIHFIDSNNKILAFIENYECTLNKNLKEKFKYNFLESTFTE